TIVNATLTANSATGGAAGNAVMATNRGNGGVGGGGAVFNLNGVVKIYNATLAANTVTGGAGQVAGAASGGAVYNLAVGTGTSATTSVRNSILAGSKGGPDLFSDGILGTSSVDAQGSNIVTSSATTGTGTIAGSPISADPMLGALAANMGPAQTMALPANSPAIGAGDPAICAAAPVSGVDERGQARTCACDLGAFAVPVPLPCPIPDLSGGSDDGGINDAGIDDDGGRPGNGYSQITGGGIGCSAVPNRRAAGALPISLLGIVGLVLRGLVRRRGR
ncbi:MAG TPA: choice-of-anchor Q domain-containing protein, partial [Pseudomonadota bacterium]|nr:choice-of-anchor Q domain-containing protein [Pseudomonadota bacterium]